MQVKVRIVNAFVDDGQGGNPAGVVLQADGLSAAQKQAIAVQVGLSETAFVSRAQSAAFRLEFFTPTKQIAHCGHATVATFALLRQQGQVGEGWTSKETLDGNRDILIRGDMVFMEQHRPESLALTDEPRLLEALMAAMGIDPGQLLPGLWPARVSTGGAFVLLPLADEARVAALCPDQEALVRLSQRLELIGFYAFSPDTRRPGRAAGARMFAPYYGIAEESATGMAAGPLACFLHERMGVAGPRLLIEQGYLMHPPSPSLITVDLKLAGGRIERLLAGGLARVQHEVVLEL
ncbi:PhzF family phenazine biosynthesis protein [Pseudomonas benzenivorans]|uniref:PhzF family phenazine biosynthesis protein n=1 Tax=Pseudomonas benzenivorans TaxID=556533 RepID=A0ABZ0PQT2_9PSED|nr:PhzF family phenazine biosynthesis protein [Pseudomonas benzenivorans]WPC03522.1 PhzF family phenazine biosynthesis protein [Pseudomonas benzenivorans]